MTNNHISNDDISIGPVSVDPFDAALDALRRAGIEFDVVGDFASTDTRFPALERAA